MKLIILGSGGCQALPRPLCHCKNCQKARINGVPYARTGPALYLQDEAILFDTPEEIRQQIEREKIKALKHVFYTHWHPDHTQGMRIFEQINSRYYNEPAKEPIKVYIPENAIADFKKHCEMIFYSEKMGWINIIPIRDRKPIKTGQTSIIPLDFKRRDRVRCGYLIEHKNKKALYTPCSNFSAKIDQSWLNLDLLILELGWFGRTQELRKKIPKNHPWQDHISFEENINIIKRILPKKTIFTHIDGTRHLTEDGDLDLLKRKISQFSKLNLDLTYDGMRIEI